MYVSWVGIGEVQKNYQLNGTAVVHLFTGKQIKICHLELSRTYNVL